MIEVVVSRLGLDSSTQSYVVILQEKDGERLLPIWIGQPEAESIVMQMHNIKRVRPLTHDLCKNLIVGLGGKLEKVHITRVEKNTYYAELHIARNGGGAGSGGGVAGHTGTGGIGGSAGGQAPGGGEVVRVDARPSDSIAIALRLSAPIFASEALLTDVQVEEAQESFDSEKLPSASELSAEQLKEYLERLRPEDFGKFNL